MNRSDITPTASLLNLDLHHVDEHTVRLPTDASFSNYENAFGGWVAAVIIDVVKRRAEFRGEVITQQIQFVAPVAAGEIDVTTTLLASRTSIDFWRVEVRDLDGALLISAEMTCGRRRETPISFEQLGPEEAGVGTPMELTDLHPGWTAQFEQVMVEGEPFTVADRPRSIVRIRPLADVSFDASLLAMICDTPMPRTFFASTGFAFPSTISLSTHIYASNQQIADVEREFVVVETDSAVIRNNTLNQELHVHRSDGLLLACSYQTALFRPS